MKKVCDLDLETNAYLSKPTSSWTLAGITNIEVWVYERDGEIDRTTTKRFSILYKGFEILQKQLENKTGLCLGSLHLSEN